MACLSVHVNNHFGIYMMQWIGKISSFVESFIHLRLIILKLTWILIFSFFLWKNVDSNFMRLNLSEKDFDQYNNDDNNYMECDVN